VPEATTLPEVGIAAVSKADAPVASAPDHAMLVEASNTTEVVLEAPTMKGSHGLVEPAWLESPLLYTAWKLYSPGAKGPTVEDEGATPLTREPAPADEPLPEHMLLPKKE